MIDSLVYGACTDNTLVNLLRNTDASWRVYPSGALGHAGIPAEPPYPYVQHGEGGSNSVLSVRETRRTLVLFWDIWCYDNPGSFIRIKNILEIVKNNLEGMTGRTALSGWRATEIVQTSAGADVFDPVKNQNSKRASFRVVTSRFN